MIATQDLTAARRAVELANKVLRPLTGANEIEIAGTTMATLRLPPHVAMGRTDLARLEAALAPIGWRVEVFAASLDGRLILDLGGPPRLP